MRILLVEDNPGDVRLLQEYLSEGLACRFQLTHASRLTSGLERLAEARFDAVLLDLSLPDSDGLDTLVRLHAAAKGVPIVVLTGIEDAALGTQLVQIGAQDYLVKGQVTGPLLARSLRHAVERKRAEERLSESEARLRAILDNSPNLIFLKDRQGRYLHVNRQFERTFHINREDIAGKTDDEVFPAAQAAVFRANDRMVLQAGVPLRFEEVALHDDGPHTSIVYKFPLHAGDGNPYAICGITTDITERKATEEALRRAEEKYRSIVDNAVEGIFQSTPEGRYVSVNPALARMYGYESPAELIAGVTDIAHEIYVDPDCRMELTQLLEWRDVVRGFEYEVYRKDGSTIWISESVRAVRDDQGTIRYYEGTIEDITERKRAEEALKSHEEQLRNTLDHVRTLRGRLETVQEEERARIARELHDELGVGLTCLKIDLSRLNTIVGEAAGAGTRKKAEDKIKAMVEHVDTTIAAVQRLVTELRPAVLDDLGLVAAIEWQCQDFQKRTGIPCTCVTSAEDIAMDVDRATSLFRICQEALTNTARHAQATAVTVKLESGDDFLRLVVADNGLGIPEAKVSDRRSLGLLGMQERAALLGGSVTITGSPDSGTTITVRVPRGS